MNEAKHYISLIFKKYNSSERECEIDDSKSFIISYKKDVNCYLCKKKSTGKVTKMANVENFIRIWNYNMSNEISEQRWGESYISVYIEKEFFSGYEHSCASGPRIPVDIIQKYICLLKDIVEEEEKEDKTVDAEDYDIVYNY
ncbi:hypothetical protein BCR42DRAFT_421179 [Absidia repens]|uniref:Uncharacterized protein n=1 Tax=Absidia repens TaxID=90262 RepID=A0A1X2I863_9FUNG|nr:hypothetical protein BCR42DRAFT_421179 [Absidia repens]